MAREYGFYDKETGTVRWLPYEVVQDHLVKQRQNPKAPYIRCDTMEPLKHQGDGKVYDSKSAFDATSKALGLVEWQPPKDWNTNGTFNPAAIDEKEIAADIERAQLEALNDLKWGNIKLTEEQKEGARNFNENYKAVTGKEPIIKD